MSKSFNAKEFFVLAAQKYKSGKYQEAIDAFRGSLAIQENLNSYRGLGWALLNTKQYSEAIDTFQKSVAIKEDWTSLFALGSALSITKQYSEAIDAFHKSIAIKEDWSSYHGLGWALFNSNQYTEAIIAFRKSIALNENWYSYRGFGSALLNTKKYAEAINIYRKALSIQEDWYSYQGLGTALFKTKQFNKAINIFRNSIAMKVSKKSYQGLVNALKKVSDQKGIEDALMKLNNISQEDDLSYGKEYLESIYQSGTSEHGINGQTYSFSYADYEKLRKGEFNLYSLKGAIPSTDKNWDESIKCSIVEDGVITNIYGVYNTNGLPYEESIITKGIQKSSRDFSKFLYPKLNLSIYPSYRDIQSAIWIKYLKFGHIGHALTEMCSSIYPLLLWAEKGFDLGKLIIIIPAKCREDKGKLAKLLNINSKQIIYVGEDDIPLKVNQLYIPRSTMVLREFMNPNHAKAVKAYLKLYIKNIENIANINVDSEYFLNKDGTIDPENYPSKLYISRSRLPAGRRKFIEEKEIEMELVNSGWTILFPERTTIAKQLSFYENANFIAGTEGSAFHLLMGITNANLKVILLSKVRRNQAEDMQINLEIQFSSLATKVESINCLEVTGRKMDSRKDVTLTRNYTSRSICRIIRNLTSSKL